MVNGQTVDFNEDIYFGFVVASSPVTNKELASLKVDIDGTEWANIDLTGYTEYTYTDYVTYEPEREIVGESVITAIVTDAAGQTATATITLNLNEEQPILANTFDWSRKGLTLESAAEMHAIGLDWPGNYRDEVFVKIVPMDGCSMYIINDGNEFDNINTLSQKNAYFANLIENGTPATQYKEISAYHDGTYNTMLAVIDADGEYHLVHFQRATTELITAGALIHLFGELK